MKAIDKVYQALIVPMTVAELSVTLQYTQQYVGSLVKQLYKSGRIHIDGQVKTRKGNPANIYLQGAAEDKFDTVATNVVLPKVQHKSLRTKRIFVVRILRSLRSNRYTVRDLHEKHGLSIVVTQRIVQELKDKRRIFISEWRLVGRKRVACYTRGWSNDAPKPRRASERQKYLAYKVRVEEGLQKKKRIYIPKPKRDYSSSWI